MTDNDDASSNPRKPILIDLDPDAPALGWMGAYFIDQLQRDSQLPQAPPAMKRDWFTVANWLGITSGELDEDRKQKINDAWSAYIEIGVAPCARLQPIFDEASQENREGKGARPPKEVLDVFDRLLATDEEIRSKRAMDLRIEGQRLQQAFKHLGKPKAPLRRDSSRVLRKMAFFSLLWMAGVFLYAWLFDPLDVGGWEELESEHFNRLWVISLLPPIAATLFAAYRKGVQ